MKPAPNPAPEPTLPIEGKVPESPLPVRERDQAARYVEEVLSPTGPQSRTLVHMLSTPYSRLSSPQKVLRDHVIHMGCALSAGETQKQQAAMLGITQRMLQEALKRHEKRYENVAGNEAAFHAFLERIRNITYEGVEQYTADLMRINAKLLSVFEEKLEAGEIDPSWIPKAVGIFTDKMLLMTGQATSRVAKLDERSRKTEDLAAEVQKDGEALEEMGVFKPKLVKGGKDETAGANGADGGDGEPQPDLSGHPDEVRAG